MNPLTTSELIAALSLVLALVVFVLSVRKDGRTDSARDQMIMDKLNQNMELAKETRDTVRKLNDKIDVHGETLARHSEQINTLFNRVKAVEDRCERHFGPRPDGK